MDESKRILILATIFISTFIVSYAVLTVLFNWLLSLWR